MYVWIVRMRACEMDRITSRRLAERGWVDGSGSATAPLSRFLLTAALLSSDVALLENRPRLRLALPRCPGWARRPRSRTRWTTTRRIGRARAPRCARRIAPPSAVRAPRRTPPQPGSHAPAPRRAPAQVDERDNMQILLFGSLSRDERDILPGHIWVEREFLEVLDVLEMETLFQKSADKCVNSQATR